MADRNYYMRACVCVYFCGVHHDSFPELLFDCHASSKNHIFYRRGKFNNVFLGSFISCFFVLIQWKDFVFLFAIALDVRVLKTC